MYIEHFHVTGFGRLVDWSPDPPPAPGLTVFYGPNEAGKSTLRRFLLSVLFGFDVKIQGRHPDNPWQGAELGGEITYAVEGERFRLRRHLRGRTAQLELFRLPGSERLPPAQAERLLATHIPVSRNLYRQLFSIELAELVQLDADTLQAVQEQFATDFETLGEIANPNQALETLAAEITSLARRKRSGIRNPLITRLEKERRELRVREREARDKIGEFQRLTGELQAAETEIEQLRRRRLRLENEIQHLKNLGPIRKIRARLRRLEARQRALEPWKDFPTGRQAELDRLRNDLEAARRLAAERSETLAEARQTLERAEQALAPFPAPERLEALRTAGERARALPELRRKLDALRKDLARLEDQARRLAAGLLPPETSEPPELFRQAFTDPAAAAERQTALEKKLETLETLEAEREKLRLELNAAREYCRTLETERKQIEARVPPDYPENFNTGLLEDAETLERLLADLPRFEERAAAAAENQTRFARALEEENAAIARTAAPWKILSRPLIAAALAATAAALGLGLFVFTPPGSPPRWVGLTLVSAAALGIAAFAFARWTAARLGAVQRERRNQLDLELAAATRATESAARELEGLRQRIARLAERAGFDRPPEPDALEQAILDRRRWAEAAPAVQRLAQLRETLGTAQARADELAKRLETAETRLREHWQAYAARVEQELGILPPPKHDPTLERRRLARAAEFAEITVRKNQIAREIAGLEAEITQRRQALETPIREFEIKLENPRDPDAARRALAEFIERAARAYRARDDAARALDQARKRCEKAEAAREKSENALARFLEKQHCTTPEEFIQHAQAAAEFARLTREIEEIRADMPEPIHTTPAAPDGENHAALPGAGGAEHNENPADWPEQTLRQHLETLQLEETRIREKIKSREAEQTRLVSQLREIEAKVDIEAIQGRIADLDARIAEAKRRRDVLVLTEYFLRQSIDEFARTHRIPVLERAGRLLERVTAGRYVELRPEDPAANRLDRLEVIPAAGGHPVPVKALSRGTSEQVFLSLRLALALEMSGGRPLPVVLDDVLVNADDQRLAGCVESIVRLGKEMQVFAFTCHERVAAQFERHGIPRCELPA